MLGIEDYGSDSDSSLPESSNVAPKSAPKPSKPQRAPKKITISLPTLSSSKDDDSKDLESDRPVKKQRTAAGSSSLFSMLPVPKESNPSTRPQSRVLGGGSGSSLSFHAAPLIDNTKLAPHDEEEDNAPSTKQNVALDEPQLSSATLFRPTSVGKGKKNISIEETSVNRPSVRPQTQPVAAPSTPAFDFFSLGKQSHHITSRFRSHNYCRFRQIESNHFSNLSSGVNFIFHSSRIFISTRPTDI